MTVTASGVTTDAAGANRQIGADGAGSGRKRRGGRPWTHAALYLFPLPAVVLYVIFFVVPVVNALQYAGTDWDGFSLDYQNVGLANLTKLATNDDLFSNALGNNLRFMLVVVMLQTFLSLLLAIFLVKNTRASIFLRALYFLPTILSSVSVAFVWRFMYDPNYGLLNKTLEAVGLDGLQSSYLGNSTFAIYWVALTQVWFHTGQLMVVYIAGLQSIPVELYESAEMDGASKWQVFRHLTWPMIAPATAIVVAYTTIQSFKAFDLIVGLGGNPPRQSLDILSTRIYTSFANSEFGYAAAESVVFMAVIAVVTLAQRWALRTSRKDV
ncbi:carbohydrate ABC transporter permease [Micromonospora sp. SL1-18]|uniref:carbohydrate ABC transporter permease n=1 Tax=Micromonospora sp. SL1-18 TaxID=3399128 RepID=UPI003A4DBF29